MADREILALILARGGSKGVSGKNIRPLGGRPLLSYTIAEAQRSKHITRIILSTDSPEIAAVGRQYGVEVPFLRPAALAEDDVQDLPVVEHALDFLERQEGYRPEIIVHLRPTAPLRRAEHIDRGIEMLLGSAADAVRSVCRIKHHPLKAWRIVDGRLLPFVPADVNGIPEAYNMPRQKLPEAYIQNGSVDVIRAATIRVKRSMTGDHILGLVMEEMESVSIDSPLDSLVAEILMQRRQAGEEPPSP